MIAEGIPLRRAAGTAHDSPVSLPGRAFFPVRPTGIRRAKISLQEVKGRTEEAPLEPVVLVAFAYGRKGVASSLILLASPRPDLPFRTAARSATSVSRGGRTSIRTPVREVLPWLETGGSLFPFRRSPVEIYRAASVLQVLRNADARRNAFSSTDCTAA